MTGSKIESNGKRPGVRLQAPRAKRTQHRKNENLRPRLIAGGAGKLGRGLAQPSDTPYYDCLKPY